MLVLWWSIGLLAPWFTIFLSSGPVRFRAYLPGGIWSVAFASLIEYLIRRHMGFWHIESMFTTFLLTQLVTFIGPRFAEGLLFFQHLPKQTSLQLPAAFLGALVALTADVYVALTGYAVLSFRSAAVSFFVHLLRFLALLSIWYGLSYERRAERLGAIQRQELRHRIGKLFWKLSWVPIYFGVRAVVGRMERRQERP